MFSQFVCLCVQILLYPPIIIKVAHKLYSGDKYMSNILITGGAGYLGTWITRLLLEDNHYVRVIDRCFFGEKPVEGFKQNNNYELIKDDIRWPSEAVFKDIDILIDLAGLSNDPSCSLNSELTQSINRDGIINFNRMAKEAGIRQVINASSCSVYGQGGGYFVEESASCNPLTLYAQSKLMVEEFLFNNLCDRNYCVTALRFGTLYGLSRRMRFDLIVNIMTARVMMSNKIFVNGGGLQWRPLVHVQDAARAFLHVLDAPVEKVNGQVFNVGANDQNFRVITVANIIHDIFPGSEMIIVPEDADERSYNVSFDKIKNHLGFKPKRNVPETVVDIRDALKDGIVEYRGDGQDDLTATTLRYRKLTGNNPLLEQEGKFRIHRSVEFYKHNIDERDILRQEKTLRSIFLTTGSITKKFEKMLADYLGVSRVIGTTSCTDSLFLVLKALGVGPGDEIITTPMTFVATANAVEHTGARPVFVDVEPETGNIDASRVAASVNKKTKAIIPVHLYGQMCDMKTLSGIAKEHGLSLIEDAAHCIEGVRDGIQPGRLSDAACFSFYATKNITCGEGGAIATNDNDLADMLVKMRLHGLSADAASRYTGDFKPFDMVLLGYKANMSNLDAALLIGQLERIDELWERREHVSRAYEKEIAAIANIGLTTIRGNSKSARHLFTIRVDSNIRGDMITALKSRGIGVAVNYPPVHLTTYYSEKYGYKPGDFPVAERIGAETISIPMYPRLTDSEIEYITTALRDISEELSE